MDSNLPSNVEEQQSIIHWLKIMCLCHFKLGSNTQQRHKSETQRLLCNKKDCVMEDNN